MEEQELSLTSDRADQKQRGPGSEFQHDVVIIGLFTENRPVQQSA